MVDVVSRRYPNASSSSDRVRMFFLASVCNSVRVANSLNLMAKCKMCLFQFHGGQSRFFLFRQRVNVQPITLLPLVEPLIPYYP